jgi:hypothetical protein
LVDISPTDITITAINEDTSAGGVVVEFDLLTGETADDAAEQLLTDLQASGTTITVETDDITASVQTNALSAPVAATTTRKRCGLPRRGSHARTYCMSRERSQFPDPAR